MLQVVRKHKRLQAGIRPREASVFKNLEDKRKVKLTGLTYKNRLTGLIPIASSFTLLGVLSLSGVAHADSTVTLNASVGEPELAINVSSSTVNLSVRPSTSGTGTASGNVTVTVGSPVTYNLYMYSNQTDLVSSAGTTPINALSTSNCAANNNNCTLASSNFTNDAWGFAVSTSGSVSENAPFRGFSGFETLASSVAASTTNTNVAFGVKVSTATNPGEYSNTLRFVAVTTAASSSTLNMQDMDINDCPANGRVLATDTRDYSVYTIQKLADGNCWMLDNLALGSTTTAYDLTPDNTNISTNWTLPISKAGSDWANSYTAPYINAAGNCTTSINTGSPDFGCSQSNRERNGNGSYTKNDEVLYDTDYVSLNGQGKIGVYYNYCAASAGTYCRNSDGTMTPSDGETLNSNDNGNRSISGDICPKGWRLPTGGSNGEYQALYNAYLQAANNVAATAQANFKTGLSTPLSGTYSGGKALSQGYSGDFWSSTRQGVALMYSMYTTVNLLFPANTDYRNNSFAVRCVLSQN